jgi:hypothetical protein
MTKADQALIDIVKDGQSGKYKPFVRTYTGEITKVVKMKNPLCGSIIVSDIERILEIMNPELTGEVAWFKALKKELKLWCNEKIISNRLLGVKNDNEYDMRVFEKVVMEKFFLSEKPKRGTIIETDFETMIELVELGARRF